MPNLPSEPPEDAPSLRFDAVDAISFLLPLGLVALTFWAVLYGGQ